MNSESSSHQATLTLEPNDTRHLALLCGQLDAHLRQIESSLEIQISYRGNQFLLSGAEERVAVGKNLLTQLYAEVCQGIGLSPESLHLQLQQPNLEHLGKGEHDARVEAIAVIRTKRSSVKPRGKNQQAYVRSIKHSDINFAILESILLHLMYSLHHLK